MNLSIVLGTRPEIIKMSSQIRECEKRGLDYFILHTGQHYSYNMDKVFFEQLRLPEAKYNLDVGSGSHTEEIGKMVIGIEKVLLKENLDVVLVEGDTNTVLLTLHRPENVDSRKRLFILKSVRVKPFNQVTEAGVVVPLKR